MKLFLALFLLVVAAGVGWYFYSVNPVIDDFQAAVATGKPDAVSPFMDVPSLKKCVADFVHHRFDQKDNPAMNPTADQVQSIVDQFVTPQTVMLMMKGIKVEPGKGPDPVDNSVPHPIVKHFESPDVYAVDVFLSQVQTPDNMVSLLFERQGWFGWKLSAFRFSWD
jgi:hypothetical protein